eukprot:352226-Chlamydomonas_euryale.AAC.4
MAGCMADWLADWLGGWAMKRLGGWAGGLGGGVGSPDTSMKQDQNKLHEDIIAVCRCLSLTAPSVVLHVSTPTLPHHACPCIHPAPPHTPAGVSLR